MPVQIQLRRGTPVDWANSNPILAEAEVGIEVGTGKFKIGDGSTPWNSLQYGGIKGPTGQDAIDPFFLWAM